MVLTLQIWVSAFKYNGMLSKNGFQRVLNIIPSEPLERSFRASFPLAPTEYFGRVASGEITPQKSATVSFFESGLILDGNKKINVDTVVLCTGPTTPRLPFFSEEILGKMGIENNDCSNLQLYRHMIHPNLKNIAFGGFNHGFLHMPIVEVGTLWTEAYFRGVMKVPSKEEMEQCIDRIQDWKLHNTVNEKIFLSGVNTRYHQYIDTLLQDLDINMYRKSNPLLEVAQRYNKEDFDGLVDEYVSLAQDKEFRTVNIDM